MSRRRRRRRWYTPLLDLVESLELRNGDEDDDGLLSTLDVDLLSGRDLESSKLSLELGNVVLEVEDGLGNSLLGLVRSGGGGVGSSLDLGGEGRHLDLKNEREESKFFLFEWLGG